MFRHCLVIVCTPLFIWSFYFVCILQMANDYCYWENDEILLKCKECWEFKELNNENWYKHPEWFLWVLWRCKQCILRWRKWEHELEMARVRDRNRYINNKKRRDFIYKSSWNRTKRHMEENQNWQAYHLRAIRLIRKLKIRPTICPICWYEWRIIAHHPDINVRNEIVFCCQICHDKIHKWKMECPKPIDLINL